VLVKSTLAEAVVALSSAGRRIGEVVSDTRTDRHLPRRALDHR
jgi:hypothetical protein